MTSFTVFPQLPAEIRQEIWKMALYSEPRIFEVYNQRTDVLLPTHWPNHPFPNPVSSTTRFPSLLRVNEEARRVALSHLSLIDLDDGKIYVNFNIDVFFLTLATMANNCWRGENTAKTSWKLELFANSALSEKIQHLAVQRAIPDSEGWPGECFSDFGCYCTLPALADGEFYEIFWNLVDGPDRRLGLGDVATEDLDRTSPYADFFEVPEYPVNLDGCKRYTARGIAPEVSSYWRTR